METSVEFANVLRLKVVLCGNAYRKPRTKGVFIDGLPAKDQSAESLFWDQEQDAHVLETAQYADTLLEHIRGGLSPMVALVRGTVFREVAERLLLWLL